MSVVSSRRRRFVGGAAAAAVAVCFPAVVAASRPRIAVVGGGFGGLSAALTAKRLMPAAEVTLIERESYYVAPPFSSFVVAGFWPLARIRRDYAGVAAFGVKVIRAAAARVRGDAVVLADGAIIPHDRAIVSPGVDFDFAAMPGFSAAAAAAMPHAYASDEAQATMLRRQLAAMPDNGAVIIVPPPLPCRCPPAPYARAGLIAAMLERRGGRGRVLVLDQKEGYPQQTLFEDGWSRRYRESLEWRSAEAGGLAEAVDVRGRRVFTEFGEERADVVNYIPPQRAAAVAFRSGLTDDSGWCPVTPMTMESTRLPGVHVVGDAAAVSPLPKSGFAAANLGRLAAAAVARALGGVAPDMTRIDNLCFSYLAPDSAFAERGSYRAAAKMEKTAQTLTDRAAGADERRQIAAEGAAWHDSAMRAMFAPTKF